MTRNLLPPECREALTDLSKRELQAIVLNLGDSFEINLDLCPTASRTETFDFLVALCADLAGAPTDQPEDEQADPTDNGTNHQR